MNQEEIMLYFKNNYPEIKESILDVTIWADEPNKDVCAEIAAGLLHLAEKKGDKNAAALYCLIAAFGHNPDAFFKDIACEMLLRLNALKAYHELIDEELFMILDDEPYSYMYAFPVTHSLKKLNTDGDTK